MKYLYITLALLVCWQTIYAQQNRAADKQKAAAYIDDGEYTKAIAIYDDLIDATPNVADAYYYRAICHFILTDRKAAVADLNKCIAIDSSLYKAFCLRAVLLDEMGMHKASIEDNKYALSIMDNAKDSLTTIFSKSDMKCMIGTCYWHIRNFDSSLAYLNSVYDADSNNRHALHNLIIVMIELKRFDTAKYYLDRYSIVAGEDQLPAHHYIWYYVNVGEYEKALKTAEELLRVSKSPGGRVYSNMAFAYHKLGNKKKALEYIEKAIDVEPDNSYAYKNRAIIKMSDGDMVNACNDLRTAQDLGYTEMWGNEVEELLLDHCNKM